MHFFLLVNPGSNFAAFQAAATGNSTASASASASTTSAPAASGTAYPGSTSPTSSSPQVHQVVVGGTGKLFYTPSNITAAAGDVIMFQFQQKNHTITQVRGVCRYGY
jgi:plastocyanin